MARHNPGEDDRITIARLDGAARRLLWGHADRDTCITELHAITQDSDLLAQAAGTALGSWQHSSVSAHGGDRVARMLVAAGADQSAVDKIAAKVRERRFNGGSGPRV